MLGVGSTLYAMTAEWLQSSVEEVNCFFVINKKAK